MAKPKVFVTRIIPDAGLKRIRELANTEIWPEDEPPPYEVLLEKLKGIAGLVCLLTDRIDRKFIEAAGESLKVISQMAVGFDNIDIEVATRYKIPVGNTPGVLTDTTADFAFALLMAAARRIVEGERYVKEGHWKTWGPTLLMGQDIHDATLGLIGFGRIGQAMAQRAQGFNMKVVFYDKYVDDETVKGAGAEALPFEEVLKQADFLSIHVPLTPDTEHMINEAAFKSMKPSAVLINTSRGPVVDMRALHNALNQGEIAYAALDVTDPEPIPLDDPLLRLENCLIVPHIASSSVATRSKMASMAADNLEAGLSGKQLPHCVNPEVYR
jgi:glyoxylate reductase